jgi:uncharacterized protein YndB with AHSA1/START domain
VLRVCETVVIAGDPARVFAATADPATMPRWQRGVSGVRRLEDGPVGVGSRLIGIREYAGMRMRWASVLTAWDPPRLLAFRSAGGSLRVRGVQRFAPTPGGTRLEATLEVEVGMLGFLRLTDMVRERVAAELRGDLQELKRFIEG